MRLSKDVKSAKSFGGLCVMKLKQLATLGLCAVLIAGCAGREANRVSVVQDGDFNRDCSSLHLEANSNDSQIKALITEHAKKSNNNAALTVVSVIIFLPALFALDLKGAAKAEYEALLQRTTHLSNIAKNQGCEPIPVKTLDDFKQEIAEEKKREAGTAS